MAEEGIPITRITVHPCGSGERRPEVSASCSNGGSSPRAWGTPCRAPPAGSHHPVHPHGRGERLQVWCFGFGKNGSSPRAWGTRRGPHHPGAGRSVHPHGRGERQRQQPAPAGGDGSSPRTWGTRFRSGFQARGFRFIPTDVGNAVSRVTGSRGRPVHPHGRGERPRVFIIEAGNSGSSPRTWGTHATQRSRPFTSRFIPTDVGNARRQRNRYGRCTVHPHGRGERVDGSGNIWRPNGSSPRTWGTPGGPVAGFEFPRFIPTDVGNAVLIASLVPVVAIHPHGRGERKTHQQPALASPGSSPRTWGTRW